MSPGPELRSHGMTAFKRTEQAANKDRVSRWELIEAIGWDAEDAGVGITSAHSVLAAKEACDSAGHELKDSTIKDLCLVALFDHGSTPIQQRVWRRYGWSSIKLVAESGLSQEAAHQLLDGPRKRQSEIREAIGASTRNRTGTPEATIDKRWADAANRLNKLLMELHELDADTEAADVVLGPQAALAREIYHRIVERQLDAEIRQLLDSEAVN